MMEDSVDVTPVTPGEIVTLPDGRVVIIVGVPDAMHGMEEVTPDAPRHKDLWVKMPDEDWAISAVCYTEEYEHHSDEQTAMVTSGATYQLSEWHIDSCEDYKPNA